MAKTVAGLFDSADEARQVVQGLIALGIRREDISVLSHANSEVEHSTLESTSARDEKAKTAGRGAAVGGAIGGTAGLITALGGIVVPGLGWALAAGPIATILTGAGLGVIGGGLIGGMINTGIPERQARFLAEGIRRGGTVVSVTIPDDRAERAEFLMREHHVVDIDERMASWRGGETREGRPREAREPPKLEDKPGPTYPQGGAGGGVWSGIAPHTDDEKAIEEHARADWLETTHGTAVGPEAGTGESGSTHAYDADFRAHHSALYGSTRQPYEDYEWAYRYGAMEADSLRHSGRDWNSVETEIRAEWEGIQPGTWEHYRDAIRYGWGRDRGARYEGPERRQAPRTDYHYRW